MGKMNSITKSEKVFLIKLSKELCVDSDELTRFINGASSYFQAHEKVLSTYDDIYTSLNNSLPVQKGSSSRRYTA